MLLCGLIEGKADVQTIAVTAELAEYPRLVAWLEAFLARDAVPSAAAYALRLCLEEAFCNIVRHAYAGLAEADRTVRVTLEPGETAIGLVFEDGGIPFDPAASPPPAYAATLDDLPVGGQGIRLIRKFAQSLDYCRDAGQNRLRLTVQRRPA